MCILPCKCLGLLKALTYSFSNPLETNKIYAGVFTFHQAPYLLSCILDLIPEIRFLWFIPRYSLPGFCLLIYSSPTGSSLGLLGSDFFLSVLPFSSPSLAP